MKNWKPKQKKGLDVTRLDLSEEEGFVLSQVDGMTSVDDLHHVTGIAEDRITNILDRLIEINALVPEKPKKPPLKSKTLQQQIKKANKDKPLKLTDTDLKDIVEKGNYRMLYEAKFRNLDNEEREKLARIVTGPDLSALCYDQDYRVIQAIFENSRFGLQHARLIAAHHRNPAGLDFLTSHQNFIRDDAVQRFLLRNVQTSNLLINKMTLRKPLIQIYQMIIGGDVAERVKRQLHKTFRHRFQRASGDECLALILKTEGRCLTMLTGIPLNAKTVALLCARTYSSMLLIQNLARWPSTPPKLLAHLSRQPMVHRNPQLLTMVIQHPNCPSNIKNKAR